MDRFIRSNATDTHQRILKRTMAWGYELVPSEPDACSPDRFLQELSRRKEFLNTGRVCATHHRTSMADRSRLEGATRSPSHRVVRMRRLASRAARATLAVILVAFDSWSRASSRHIHVHSSQCKWELAWRAASPRLSLVPQRSRRICRVPTATGS